MPVTETLERISQDLDFHGIIATTGHDEISNVEGLSAKTPFTTHSVGKIFSGVLMAEMLAQGIITEADLEKKGIELPEEVTKTLVDNGQTAVLERLSQVSILQAMTHTANLGDFLDNHLNRSYRGEEGAKSMSDLVGLVTNNFEGKENYSNDGLLFGSIALQHLYNQKRPGENLSYEQLLHKLVIEPSGTNISMSKPAGAYHDTNTVDFPANPAGGHYASVRDLEGFGAYLVERCKDEKFMEAVKKYGSEFYKKDKNMIAHMGDFEGNTPSAPGSATGFGVFLDSGKTVVVFTNIDASKQDRDNHTMPGCHGHRFFKELRDAVIEEEKSLETSVSTQSWSEKFPKKKAAEAEGLIAKKKSWQEIVNNPNQSRDDSAIR